MPAWVAWSDWSARSCLVATEEFHLTSDTLIFSFIVAFGVVKALSNVASGLVHGTWLNKKS
jgi:hypothetical protein